MSVHRWTMGGLATLAALMSIFLFSAQADASIGEFTISSTFGSFEGDEGMAVDESTGDVYVYDFLREGGVISKFDAEGNPVAFSAIASSKITGVGSFGSNEVELAVDNSGGLASGDIYLAGGGGVKIYGSDGKALGQLTEVSGKPWGEVCGVAVDGSGQVFVGLYPSNVNKYTPTSNPVTNGDYASSLVGLNEVCNIAAAPKDGLYVSQWSSGPIVKYNLQLGGASQVVADARGRLAVADSPSAELFVDHRTDIQQYDAAGNLLSSFGAGESSDYRAVAINAKSGKLYAYNSSIKAVEIWQGVLIPGVHTNQASDLNAVGSATLNGNIDPEEASVETCSFQYGTSVSYGSTTPCAQAMPLTGDSAVPVSAGISGVTPNHVYHYRLAVTDKHGTVNGTDLTFIILVLPTVEDQAPTVSSIARASAKLTGTINPEQVDASYRFEYGTTDSYGHSTPTAHTGSSEDDVTVSQQLGELLPDTTYHYRLVANNVAGIAVGADHTFITGASALPAAVTGGSSSVTQNTATIAGAINTNGLPTTYGFEVGTSTDYGPPTGLGAIGAGASEAPVSLALTGLQPGTTYHYRLTATNVDGTTHGVDRTFTTGTFANTSVTPPAPLPFVAVPTVAFPLETAGSASITPKALTRAQKLANALRACRKKAKGRRTGCEKQAHKKYGTAKQKRKKQ